MGKINKTVLGIAFFAISLGFVFCDEKPMALTQEEELAPFPQNQLDSEIVDYFYLQIMKELEMDFAHQSDGRTHRDTREYGYSFFKMENGDFSYTAPPEFLQAFGNKICESLGHPHQEFNNIILSAYKEGFHLEPHFDINSSDPHEKGYYFDENVYGIIIEADATGHLYIVRDDVNLVPPLDLAPIYSIEEKRGTVFCLQGKYRRLPYFHGVSRVSRGRVSITFRKVIIDNVTN